MVEISYAATKPHLLGQKRQYFCHRTVLLNKGQNNVIDMFLKIFINTTRWVFVNFDWAMVFYGEGEGMAASRAIGPYFL